MGDESGAERWRTFLAADSTGLLIVLGFGLVIFFVLRPHGKGPP